MYAWEPKPADVLKHLGQISQMIEQVYIDGWSISASKLDGIRVVGYHSNPPSIGDEGSRQVYATSVVLLRKAQAVSVLLLSHLGYHRAPGITLERKQIPSLPSCLKGIDGLKSSVEMIAVKKPDAKGLTLWAGGNSDHLGMSTYINDCLSYLLSLIPEAQEDETLCINCGVNKRDLKSRRKRCHACHTYRLRKGEERPAETSH